MVLKEGFKSQGVYGLGFVVESGVGVSTGGFRDSLQSIIS